MISRRDRNAQTVVKLKHDLFNQSPSKQDTGVSRKYANIQRQNANRESVNIVQWLTHAMLTILCNLHAPLKKM